jgi:hypothetical protein
MSVARFLFFSLLLLQGSTTIASELECENEECDAEMLEEDLEEEEEFSVLQSRVRVGRSDEDGQAVDHRLGHFSKLTVEGLDGNDGACKVEGIWHDDHGTIEFLTSDTLLSLRVPHIPTFKQHVQKKDGTSHLVSLEIGGVKISSAEEPDDKVMVAINALANSTRFMKRGKRLSSLLGKNGLPGDRAACAMRLHLALASLDKSTVESEVGKYGTPDWAAAAISRRRRRIEGSKTGPYGFADVCPEDGSALVDWKCGLDNGSPMTLTPGSAELQTLINQAQSSIFSDVECVGTTANPGCTGMCGRDCDCWEGICSSSYDCGYNRYCCAHDMSCMRRRVGSAYRCYNPTVGTHC